MPIPLFDIDTPRANIRDRLVDAATRTIDGGAFILGPELEAFEREFAAYLGADHVVGVANGTDALTIALRAMGVGPGDDVVVPSFTFYASAEAIPPTGARPVFCDVDTATGCMTAYNVRAALTPATKAVIAALIGIARCSRAARSVPGSDAPAPRCAIAGCWCTGTR